MMKLNDAQSYQPGLLHMLPSMHYYMQAATPLLKKTSQKPMHICSEAYSSSRKVYNVVYAGTPLRDLKDCNKPAADLTAGLTPNSFSRALL